MDIFLYLTPAFGWIHFIFTLFGQLKLCRHQGTFNPLDLLYYSERGKVSACVTLGVT